MSGRKTLLTDDVMDAIVEAIRGGAYDWVATEAAGIGRRTFYDWCQRGERGREPYARFATAVRQARAQARLRAERLVFEQDPKTWLRNGPGKERPGAPGWTNGCHSEPAVETEDAGARMLHGVAKDLRREGRAAEALRLLERLRRKIEEVWRTLPRVRSARHARRRRSVRPGRDDGPFSPRGGSRAFTGH